MNLFVAPHSDDETLFGSYIIMRNQPIKVVVCTDGFLHKEHFDIDIEVRRQESRDACQILGCDVEFLGLSDKRLVIKDLRKKLEKYNPELVFAPMKTGGHRQHDAISDLCKKIWEDKVWYYGIYSKNNLAPHKGEQGFIPSTQERQMKRKALMCYLSQLSINRSHFEAVYNVPEYLSREQI